MFCCFFFWLFEIIVQPTHLTNPTATTTTNGHQAIHELREATHNSQWSLAVKFLEAGHPSSRAPMDIPSLKLTASWANKK